jgi:RNA polymerase sigma factor (sigma-70 family)
MLWNANKVPLGMSPDPETGKDERGAGSAPRLLAQHAPLVERLFAESGAESWGLSPGLFEAALERSAGKRFGAQPALPKVLEEYLSALHLKDLGLASACAEGHVEAWEHFVATYRGYLRAAASAILRCSAASSAACDLADSLFADLYGLREGRPAQRSLFRYFHGRSSLKTWLRAVLAQRHIDAVRAGRRLTELDDEDRNVQRARSESPDGPRVPSPADPHRERYLAVFKRTLTVALCLLAEVDRERLRLYYAEELTLAEIGRQLGEHESSVSRNLERIRRELRQNVEDALRKNRVAANGSSPEPGLSEEQISLCFEYASEDAPIDLEKLFPPQNQPSQKSGRRES